MKYSIIPQNAIYYFCKPNIPRLDSSILQRKSTKVLAIHTPVLEAYSSATKTARKDDFIFYAKHLVVAELPINKGL
jgi:dihydrofolate synthase/folylpolyglutamate synthase